MLKGTINGTQRLTGSMKVRHGLDGVSPTIDVVAKEDMVTLEITDINGTKTANLDVANKASAIVQTVQGETIAVNDASNGYLIGLRVFGKSTQSGTPTPTEPVDIVVVENATVTIDEQDLFINNTLHGVPTTSGGNYNASGRQYVCDEADLERGVLVKRIARLFITKGTHTGVNTTDKNFNIFSFTVCNYDETGHSVAREVPAMCNKFKHRLEGYKPGVFGVATISDNGWGGTARALFYVDKSIATIDEFMAVVGDDLYIDYAMPEAIETNLATEEIEAYKSLHTNYPSTVVTNDAGATMEVSYVADTKLYIDNKIAELLT